GHWCDYRKANEVAPLRDPLVDARRVAGFGHDPPLTSSVPPAEHLDAGRRKPASLEKPSDSGFVGCGFKGVLNHKFHRVLLQVSRHPNDPGLSFVVRSRTLALSHSGHVAGAASAPALCWAACGEFEFRNYRFSNTSTSLIVWPLALVPLVVMV